MAKVSVIIPCYNQGLFIDDAVNSVLNQSFQDFEIIIVNDGSSDDLTNRILSSYDRPKTKVIHTSNQGLPSARNSGVREAVGKYILPLDADDRIGSTYLEQAVDLLDREPELGIVYCKAEFFGERSGSWNIPNYSFNQMLAVNIIFCSSVFRRLDWEIIGGYRVNMRYGYEDWDFWLSLLELGRKVYCIQNPLFFYRIRPGSMGHSMAITRKVSMYLQIYRNHRRLYLFNFARHLKGLVAFFRQASYGQRS